jgi:hypothetical protein
MLFYEFLENRYIDVVSHPSNNISKGLAKSLVKLKCEYLTVK